MDWRLFFALFIAISVGTWYTDKVKKEYIQKKKVEDMKKSISEFKPKKLEEVKKLEILEEPVEEEKPKKTKKKAKKKND